MKLIVISSPENIPAETDHIQQLFSDGLEIFHLRKPDCTIEEFENTLKQLPPTLYKKIVIHSHYKLVEKYNLKGIHLTSWFIEKVEQTELKQMITSARKRNLTVSGSFHSIKELENFTLQCDYVFLGPLFDSISKENYTAKINHEEASSFLRKKKQTAVIALGGIDESNIKEVREMGFDGAALVGAIWNKNEPSINLKKIKNQLAS